MFRRQLHISQDGKRYTAQGYTINQNKRRWILSVDMYHDKRLPHILNITRKPHQPL